MFHHKTFINKLLQFVTFTACVKTKHFYKLLPQTVTAY